MFGVIRNREEWDDYKAKLNAIGVPPGEEPEHVEHIGEPDVYPSIVCSVQGLYGSYEHYFMDTLNYPESWEILIGLCMPRAC